MRQWAEDSGPRPPRWESRSSAGCKPRPVSPLRWRMVSPSLEFPSSDRCCKRSFHIDEIEKEFPRNSSVKVITQPGSSTDLDSAQPRALLYHQERIWPARP